MKTKLFLRFVLTIVLAGLLATACGPAAPTAPPSMPIQPSPIAGGRCGDGKCDGPENAQICPQDCVPTTAAPTTPTSLAPASAKPADLTLTLGSTLPDLPILPLLGVNVGPVPAGEPGNADLTAAYQEIGVTMIRTHDYYGPLDMATIYPNQDADPDDPASYDFTASDQVFAAILAGGFEPYLRLGDSWNNAPGYPKADPRQPINPDNWVRAAVQVVRHYREFSQREGILLRYVEIWNEPDNRQFWDGRPVEFFDLFAKTAQALKSAFPDLMIGGPGLLPSASISPEGQRYTQALLDYMQKQNAPLDFLSWHIYSNNPADFVNAAVFHRQQLDRHGYTQAESHITEWNTQFREKEGENDPKLRVGAKGASLMTAAWIGLQEQGVDVATFYRGTDTSVGLPTFYGMFYADGRPKPVALAFKLWAEMAAHPERLSLNVTPTGGPLWTLAGQNASGEVAVLIANPGDAPTILEIELTDGRKPAGYTVKQVSDASESLQVLASQGPAVKIGAYTVQLVVIDL